MDPQNIVVKPGNRHAADFVEAVIRKTTHHLLGCHARSAHPDKHPDQEPQQCADQAKTTPARAAKTIVLISEIKTIKVTILRALALIFVLYVAVMRRTNDTAYLPIAVGTALWFVAAIVLLIFQVADPLWIGVCAVAAITGLIGLIYLGRRAKRPGITYE